MCTLPPGNKCDRTPNIKAIPTREQLSDSLKQVLKQSCSRQSLENFLDEWRAEDMTQIEASA